MSTPQRKAEEAKVSFQKYDVARSRSPRTMFFSFPRSSTSLRIRCRKELPFVFVGKHLRLNTRTHAHLSSPIALISRGLFLHLYRFAYLGNHPDQKRKVSDTGLLEVARRCSALTTLDLSRSELPFKIGDVTLMVRKTSRMNGQNDISGRNRETTLTNMTPSLCPSLLSFCLTIGRFSIPGSGA